MVMLTKIKVFWIIALSFAKHRVLNFAASLHRKPASSRTSLDSCRAQQWRNTDERHVLDSQYGITTYMFLMMMW